jgi:anti-sigma factor RsiW
MGKREMKANKSHIDPELLTRLYDGEITPEENASLLEHLKECEDCQKEFTLNKEISKKFQENVKRELSDVNLPVLERKILKALQAKRAPFWTGLRKFLTAMKFLVPAAAAAGIMFIFFSTVKGPSPDASPSAIINSFTGEVSSVMILETPQSHQTIIWINET